MKQNLLLLTSAIVAALISSASASVSVVSRIQAHNYGYDLYYSANLIDATNNISWSFADPYDPTIQYGSQPYDNTIHLLANDYTHDGSNYGQDGIAEFSVTDLGDADFYYLEISPTGLAGGLGMPSFDIYKAFGNGLVQPDDFDAGIFFSAVSLLQDGALSGWYNPNAYGGFYGDSYVDITSFVNSAKDAGESFLLFRYDAPEGNQYFRAPAILASDSILENQWGSGSIIPEPTSILLTMFAGGMMLIRRKR